jgi:hypothetical protein
MTVTPPVHTERMDNQLVLLEPERPWKLDRRTVERGRRGLARARRALHAGAADRQAAADHGEAA